MESTAPTSALTRRRFLVLAALAPVGLAACGQTLAGTGGSTSASASASGAASPAAAAASAISSAAASVSASLSAPSGTLVAFDVGAKNVTLIDVAKNEVTATKALGAAIRWLNDGQTFWDGKEIWTYDFPANKLQVLSIDPSTWQVTKRVPVGNGPGHSVVLSKDHKIASINVAGDNKIVAVDTASGKVTGSAATGKFPCDLDNSADFSQLYTPERDQDTVAMFDAATLHLTKRVAFPSGSNPHMLRVSPDGATVWVQTVKAGTNVVLKAADLSVLSTQKVGKAPVSNAWSPDGAWAIVTNSGDDTATLFNAKTYKAVRTITVGQGPSNVAFRPDGKFAYISLTGANSVAVVDTGTWELAKTVKVGPQPQGLILLP